VLSTHSREAFVLQALRDGASAYVASGIQPRARQCLFASRGRPDLEPVVAQRKEASRRLSGSSTTTRTRRPAVLAGAAAAEVRTDDLEQA
jgi:hypothetical protein